MATTKPTSVSALLKGMRKQFAAAAPIVQGKFEALPVGEYNCEIVTAEINVNKWKDCPQIDMKLKVIDGEYENRIQFYRTDVTEERMGNVKGLLEMLGIECADIDDLEAVVANEFAGILVAIKQVEAKDGIHINTYLNERLAGGVVAESEAKKAPKGKAATAPKAKAKAVKEEVAEEAEEADEVPAPEVGMEVLAWDEMDEKYHSAIVAMVKGDKFLVEFKDGSKAKLTIDQLKPAE